MNLVCACLAMAFRVELLDSGEKVDAWFAEQKSQAKQVLVVEWTQPNTGRVRASLGNASCNYS